MIDEHEKIASKKEIALLLAAAGGFLDAYSYLARGKVFANAETGNMVLLGMNMIEGNYMNAFHYFLPIFSYFVGIIIAEIIRHKFEKQLHWRELVLIIEIIILIIIFFLDKHFDSLVNVLISLICALQVQSFKKMGDLSFASTMCTGNLIKSANCLSKYFFTREKKHFITFRNYLMVILTFILGAVLGALAVKMIDLKAIAVPAIIITLAYFLLLKYKVKLKNDRA